MVMANSNAPVVAAAGSAVTTHATTTVNATTMSPSPQQVGREFVRQYYTILHEAPDMLHRFYSAGSTFVHGGIDRPGHSVEEPVVGQLEIDKKIKQLAFKDCHTKIRQVDSQSTIGSGVVVQVTGELSNNGEPMRRFMQTFVLAPQTPKKYYVHNDIFRYQDEVYQDLSDTESEETSPAPVVQVQNSQPAPTVVQPVVQQQQQAAEVTHHQLTTSVQASAQSNTTSATSDYHHHDGDSNTALLNGHLHSASSTASSSSSSSSSSILNHAAEQAVAQLQHHHHHHHEPETKLVIEAPIAEEIITKKEEVQVHKSEPASSEPKSSSWAKIITNKANDAAPNQQQNVSGQTQHHQPAPVTTTANTQQQQQQQQQPTGKPQREARQGQKTSLQNGSLNKSAGKRNNSSGNGSISQQQQPQQQQQQSQQSSQQQSGGSNRPRGGNKETNNNHNKENRELNSAQRDANNNKDFEDLEDKDKIRYPDNQQVFVGNLNPEISDAELTQFFSQYGKVLEVRINTNTKQQSGRRLPNYGFVVFDDKNSVEILLGNTKSNNLTFKSDKGEYRLNVEEKRARQGRGAGGAGNINFGGNKRATRSTSNGSNSNNQQQQQQQQAPSNKKNFDRKENIETSGGGEGRKTNSNYRRS